MLECVMNVSEGRDRDLIQRLASAADNGLLDVHTDEHHNRCVLTIAGPDVEALARRVAAEAVAAIDVRVHDGAHPWLGAVDVVPFVPLAGSSLEQALEARGGFARWEAAAFGIPCFLYGPERTLPDVRRSAFSSLVPDEGPRLAHPTAGATAVGARGPLVAYNLWLDGRDMAAARSIATELRGEAVRALALDVGGRPQVSCNLVDPSRVGPEAIFDEVSRRATVLRAELVGLVPAPVLEAVPEGRHALLGLRRECTIEARLEAARLS